MEMTVTLRTLLRELEFSGTYRPAERFHSRGVAMAPSAGGLAVVHRRPRTTTQTAAELLARSAV
jgi:hypothetical protein